MVVVGNKIVLDACVPIDLSIDHVNFLKDFLNCLSNDIVYISSTNYYEIGSLTIRNTLRDSNKVKIIDDDENEFTDFSKEMRRLNIMLSKPDRHVLFLAQKLKADYVVSSDDNVRDKVDRYREHIKLKNMKTFTTISLLEYLYRNGRIQYETLLDKGLYLFKNKEIENALGHLNDNNLNMPKIDDCKLNLIYKFELYRNPIVTQFKYMQLHGDKV